MQALGEGLDVGGEAGFVAGVAVQVVQGDAERMIAGGAEQRFQRLGPHFHAQEFRLGGGVVYSGKSVSTSSVWSIVTPSRTTVDALAEINWNSWRFALNATNLLNNQYYASCLARGDCFMGAPRNVMGTIGFRF